jgi:exodeoxyribonuclease VII small subunit
MDEQSESDLPYEAWDKVAQTGEFEDALLSLREVVGHLEAGHLRLNESLRCFEIGTALARRCERLLSEAELRVSRLDADDELAVKERT